MPDCGNVLTEGATNAPDSNCTVKCVGDPNEYCGGTNSLNIKIYWNGATLQPLPTIAQYPSFWYYMGCYA